ncbi:SusC/RagA family TonB-linked outer membrane protein [Gracilimonas tropica]|uniref:SusC/RagA family TonB-linked outer membrane protein n=1 Tax=Gracilimonas tropica TaxID=454600 RepID=UPI0003A6B02A|nr:SusC/RagA family TonB-linked outer membrane protein [Gracilimonas tropica]
MFKKLLFMALAMFMSVSAYAQSGTLTGEVTDAETGEALIGATVYIESIQRGAQTNIDGEYTINDIPSGTYTVSISYVGYQTFEQDIEIGSGTTTLDAQLSVDLVGLDEVVVTGFGTIDRQAFTGTVSSVSSEALESVPVASVDQALQGNAAGVVVTSSTGTPGAVQQIRIRGISSVNADTDPLFVIDGVPVINGNNAASGATSSLGVLANLSSSDIESITILKDAASTAPYGARGTNGVVVITTKQGRSGSTTYSVSAQRGFNSRAVEGETPMGAEAWDALYYTAAGNYLESGFGLPNTRAAVDQYIGTSGWDGETDTDWGEVVRNEDAVQQEYNISARGGNDVTNFYASAGIFGQEGQVIGSQLDRISGSLDVSHRLDDRVRIQNSFNGSFVEQDGILEGAGYFGSPVLAEYFMKPIDRAYNDDGTPNINNLSTNIFNPVYVQANDIDRKRNYRIRNNTKIDVNIAENLMFTTRFAADYLETEEKYYNDVFYGDSDDVSGSVDDISTRNFNYVWQNVLSYIWVPNSDHNFTFKGISESQRNYNYYLEAYGEGIAAPGLYNLNTVASPQFVGSSTTDWAVQSFTGLVNYGFQGKIYADASLRYEGNSRFAEDERWGTFWSLGLGYVITEEEFMQDLDFLNYLKVRASYGKTGNSGVGLNQYQATVGFGSYYDISSIQPSNLGNRNLTWETANSVDLGLEFEVLERVSGGVTFFRKDSKDLLFNVPLSRTTGHNSQTQNIGELYNQGIEIEANVDVVRTRDFKWNIGGNFSNIKNEVTDLPQDGNGEDIEITTGTRYTAVRGYEVNAWYMRGWAGVDPENGDPLWYTDETETATTNNYNEAERYYQGANALPTTFGGVNTRFDFMNFYASANLYYSFGNKVYDNWAFYMRSDGAFGSAFGQYARQADYWTPENTDAPNPRPLLGGNLNSNSGSSRFLYDGDYLRLKTVNIGYNVPAKYLQEIGLKSATVYFVGQNLWTYVFDDELNYDPEVQASGFTSLQAAPLKSVTFGVKVNF